MKAVRHRARSVSVGVMAVALLVCAIAVSDAPVSANTYTRIKQTIQPNSCAAGVSSNPGDCTVDGAFPYSVNYSDHACCAS